MKVPPPAKFPAAATFLVTTYWIEHDSIFEYLFAISAFDT
jgi:hypothetical protein